MKLYKKFKRENDNVYQFKNFEITFFKKYKIDYNKPTQDFGIKVNNNDVVILTNGPSLKEVLETDKFLNFINGKKLLAVNFFPLTEYFSKLEPEFLFLADPIFFNKDITDDLKIKISKLDNNIKTVNWELTVFMPKAAEKWNCLQDTCNKNPHTKIVYINTKEDKSENITKEKLEKYRLNIACPRVQNVLIGCIYVGINIGFKNIYIFGADHSGHKDMHIDENNNLWIKNTHFYKDDSKSLYIPFRKSKDELFSLREIFMIFSIINKAYEELAQYAKYMKVNVYNMTENSFIDAFERKKL